MYGRFVPKNKHCGVYVLAGLIVTALLGRSCIDVTANGSDNATGWPTGGDYYGLTAAPDGRFHALWPEPRTGAMLLPWTAAIEVKGNAAEGN